MLAMQHRVVPERDNVVYWKTKRKIKDDLLVVPTIK
jgi:hypothetical protein